ncbi:hypothetical protein Vafri_15393 [Volvox africanus]|uniref:Uncharacterized protein n=1 Tax=Volvox africanus TaxID=51714 RepID=A0A8J4BGZ8_9CHLO|nr:hypothetical protein Vafri_15393 [Volvox africanus]
MPVYGAGPLSRFPPAGTTICHGAVVGLRRVGAGLTATAGPGGGGSGTVPNLFVGQRLCGKVDWPMAIGAGPAAVALGTQRCQNGTGVSEHDANLEAGGVGGLIRLRRGSRGHRQNMFHMKP